MEHSCSECIHGEYIEVDIDIWAYRCEYSLMADTEECKELYSNKEDEL